jgi:PilZ domain
LRSQAIRDFGVLLSSEDLMTTGPVQHERRSAQRFEFNLPVHIRNDEKEYCGCTQDVSARGMFLLLDSILPEGAHVDLVFSMPAEITLGEAMRVRCRGKILRVYPCASGKFGIAVGLESYTYLATGDKDASASAFERIAGLHGQHNRPDPETTVART